MKERPILFNDEMVRAILEGRKTQTRRVMKPQPELRPDQEGGHWWPSNMAQSMVDIERDFKGHDSSVAGCLCPHGGPGDLLWVREKFATHFIWDDLPPVHIDIQNHSDGFFYSDGTITSAGCEDHQRGKWRPSIHMPRFASRITLEITDVRVERLQDISEEDARAEGIFDGGCLECGENEPCGCSCPSPDARDAFIHLWGSIYGHDSWASNPWVWVIEFRRVDQ